MLSPTWVFGVPALAAMGGSLIIFAVTFAHLLGLLAGDGPFGASWGVIAGFMFVVGHMAGIMAAATHLLGVREGYRASRPMLDRWSHLLSLEHLLSAGAAMMIVATISLVVITAYWSQSSFRALPNIVPLVMTVALGTTGLQTMLGGFLLSIVAGHDATFATVIGGRGRHRAS